MRITSLPLITKILPIYKLLNKKKQKNPLIDKEYEKARAQRIVDNIPPDFEKE